MAPEPSPSSPSAPSTKIPPRWGSTQYRRRYRSWPSEAARSVCEEWSSFLRKNICRCRESAGSEGPQGLAPGDPRHRPSRGPSATRAPWPASRSAARARGRWRRTCRPGGGKGPVREASAGPGRDPRRLPQTAPRPRWPHPHLLVPAGFASSALLLLLQLQAGLLRQAGAAPAPPVVQARDLRLGAPRLLGQGHLQPAETRRSLQHPPALCLAPRQAEACRHPAALQERPKPARAPGARKGRFWRPRAGGRHVPQRSAHLRSRPSMIHLLFL